MGAGERRTPLTFSRTLRDEYRKIHGTDLPYLNLRDIRQLSVLPSEFNGMGTAILEEKGLVM